MIGRILGVVSALIVAGAAWFTYTWAEDSPEKTISNELPTPVSEETPDEEPTTAVVVIAEGETAREVGDKLEASGIIDSARQFRTLVALMGIENELPAGEYEFEQGMPVLAVIEQLRQGATTVRDVTVREGLRLEEIAEVLEEAEIVTARAFLRATEDRKPYDFEFLKQIPRRHGLEGYLFPATYTFREDVEAEEVVRTMLQAFEDNVPADVIRAARRQGLDLHEMMTVASIVEREAQVARERPIIASVYLNRIENGMRLQADPTTQYAVVHADPESAEEHGWWKRELTVDDIALKDPYNTYAVDGLPPGPIAAPGLASIEAVARPAKTNFLFFVACGGEGAHEFAATLADHEANVARCVG